MPDRVAKSQYIIWCYRVKTTPVKIVTDQHVGSIFPHDALQPTLTYMTNVDSFIATMAIYGDI